MKSTGFCLYEELIIVATSTQVVTINENNSINEKFAYFSVGVMKDSDHTSKRSDGFSIDMPLQFWDINRPDHSGDQNCTYVHAAKPGGISGVGYFKDIECENNLLSVCHVNY